MNNDNRGFTIEALVVRLIVLAFAAVAIPRTSEKIQKTSGAFSTGLRAIQYRWLDWTIPSIWDHERQTAPKSPSSAPRTSRTNVSSIAGRRGHRRRRARSS